MLERWISRLLVGSIVATVFSIAASSVLFGAVGVLWVVLAIRERSFRLQLPPFTPMLIAFSVAVLLAVVFSEEPSVSASYLVRLTRFLPVFWVYTFLSRAQVKWTVQALLLATTGSAVLGILQYFWLMEVHLMNRIHGFMSHWMTFSGQLMICLVALAGLLLLGRHLLLGERLDSWWKELLSVRLLLWATALAVISLALLLTFTRNAWIGATLGVACLVFFFDKRWLIPAAVGGIILLLLLPAPFTDRLYAAFDFTDTTNQGRFELFRTGIAMVQENPVTGVGPRMIPILAPQFAHRYLENDDFPPWLYQHLHNSPLQVAAEMGFIGLAAWLGLWLYILWSLWRISVLHKGDKLAYYLSVTGICVLVAFLSAGLFEYNFGDSEIITLLLFFVTAPYVVIKTPRPAA